ncbi:hypothetical protein AYX15_04613 [Cryptococcus neoformans]|nr:hypothetical protein AYX15_04613 [Cryptococcus neoformans var. grubii]
MSGPEIVSSAIFPLKPHNSPAAKVPGLIFCSGQIGNGEIEAATLESLTKLKALLELGGSSLEQIVKINIFMKDINQFNAMNEVFSKFLPNPKPARTCIQAGKLPGGETSTIEIECIAQV